ncbi:hypothetical protein [Aeromonas veronii]|uniref:hypothetical protein n=1 Tax=Aeromonas veronii TaxID=654 RepID=UPI0012686217|nr:hypothetical protein [Aeromonas veronii]
MRSSEGNNTTWIPSAGSPQDQNKALASSFIRMDIGADKIWGLSIFGFGIIYGEPIKKVSDATPNTLCIFPINANSNNRTNRGCGPNLYTLKESNTTDLSYCASMGIDTADAWFHLDYNLQCSFNIHDKNEANEAILAQMILNESAICEDCYQWNEILVDISSWGSNPAELPISALWYHKSHTSLDRKSGLAGAQNEQKLFYEQSGLFIPILSISNDPADAEVFSYSPDEQVIDPYSL